MPQVINTYRQWLAEHRASYAICPRGCHGGSPVIFATDEIVASGAFLDGGILYCEECLKRGRVTGMAPVRAAAYSAVA